MTAISVRQSGGANIVSLPKAIVKTLGLSVGSKLELTIKNNAIEWLDAKPVGKEV